MKKIKKKKKKKKLSLGTRIKAKHKGIPHAAKGTIPVMKD